MDPDLSVDDVCTICLCDLKAEDYQCKLTCSHVFHSVCIQQWLLLQKTCPVCRAQDSVCQHGSTVDHDKETLEVLFRSQQNSLLEARRVERELRDHIMALNMVQTRPDNTSSFFGFRRLFINEYGELDLE